MGRALGASGGDGARGDEGLMVVAGGTLACGVPRGGQIPRRLTVRPRFFRLPNYYSRSE